MYVQPDLIGQFIAIEQILKLDYILFDFNEIRLNPI